MVRFMESLIAERKTDITTVFHREREIKYCIFTELVFLLDKTKEKQTPKRNNNRRGNWNKNNKRQSKLFSC